MVPPTRSHSRSSRSAEASTVDVARRANVSLGTVSRVMNHHPGVASDLRRRVWLASRELGFMPRRPSRCVAVITGRRSPALPVGYVSVMVSLISQRLTELGYIIELIDIENLELAYSAHIEAAIGVVFDQRLAELQDIPNLPLLTINKPMTELGIHGVRADHYQQALLATRHFLERGHRRIAFLAIEPDEWGSRQRRQGFEDALRDAGLQPEPGDVNYSIQQPIYDILSRWVQRGITAILNFSEDASLEVLHILSNVLKLRIGQNISTISLEDLPIYRYLTPPQTTVHQPLEQLAELAVEKTLQLVQQTRCNEPVDLVDICLPSRLDERDSVADLRQAQ